MEGKTGGMDSNDTGPDSASQLGLPLATFAPETRSTLPTFPA